MIAYIALFSALLSRLTALACGSAWVTSFIARFFLFLFLNIHRSGVLTALAWLVPHETAAVAAQVLCTPYKHALCHFMQSHILKVYACLAVTCHLHFWQNDRDLLRATVVTRGWNGYRSKSQHRKSTLEKKILQPFQQGFEPAIFQSRVRRSNHWAIPVPPLSYPRFAWVMLFICGNIAILTQNKPALLCVLKWTACFIKGNEELHEEIDRSLFFNAQSTRWNTFPTETLCMTTVSLKSA